MPKILAKENLKHFFLSSICIAVYAMSLPFYCPSVKLVGGGSVIKGAYPRLVLLLSSDIFYYLFPKSANFPCITTSLVAEWIHDKVVEWPIFSELWRWYSRQRTEGWFSHEVGVRLLWSKPPQSKAKQGLIPRLPCNILFLSDLCFRSPFVNYAYFYFLMYFTPKIKHFSLFSVTISNLIYLLIRTLHISHRDNRLRWYPPLARAHYKKSDF